MSSDRKREREHDIRVAHSVQGFHRPADVGRRGGRVDHAGRPRRHERVHRRRLPEGGAGRRWPGGSSEATARGDQFSDQRLDRRVHRTRAGRRAGGGRRDRPADALPVRSGHPRQDQRRPAGLPRHPPVARGADGVGGLLRPARRRAGRGGRHHRRRAVDPVVLGRQQQDLDRPGRPGHPRGQLLAARRAGGDARHLLRHRAAPEPQADPDPDGPPTGSACPICAARRRRSSRSSRRTPPTATPPSRRRRRDLAAHRRARARFPELRGAQRPAARHAAAAAIGRRQHRQCRAGRARRRPVPGADRLHRSHPGRHAGPAALGHAELRLGDGLLAQRRRRRRPAGQHRRLPRPDHPAPAGDQQPPRGDPAARAAWP